MPFKKNLIPWNKTNTTSICLHCEKEFHISPSRLKDTKIKRGVYCSKDCSNKHKVGKPSWNSGVKGEVYKKHYQRGFGGIFFKEERMFNGSLKEYMSLHHWVRTNLGKPNKCEHCGGLFSGKNIQWANKSKLYKKEIGDWIRLCARCHHKYDRQEQRKIGKLASL